MDLSSESIYFIIVLFADIYLQIYFADLYIFLFAESQYNQELQLQFNDFQAQEDL